jgi:parafibromin
LLSLANIKAFLQDSIYVDPNTNDPALQEHLSDPTAVRNISHHFSKLNKKFTFLVVNNTDRFTRPEYWDRVVAIFSTGQEWQFKNYKWSNPKELFQKIKGYYFYYKGDTVPQNVKEWNVQKIPIDRLRRFKDAEVLNYFWDEVEKSLVQRGF